MDKLQDDKKPTLHVVQGQARRAPSGPFGSTTQRFFADGEQKEAEGWPNEEQAPREKGGDFDRIPRQKGLTLVLAIFSACLALGVVLAIKGLAGAGRKVDASSAAFRQSAGQILPPVPDAGVDASDGAAKPASGGTAAPGIRI